MNKVLPPLDNKSQAYRMDLKFVHSEERFHDELVYHQDGSDFLITFFLDVNNIRGGDIQIANLIAEEKSDDDNKDFERLYTCMPKAFCGHIIDEKNTSIHHNHLAWTSDQSSRESLPSRHLIIMRVYQLKWNPDEIYWDSDNWHGIFYSHE